MPHPRSLFTFSLKADVERHEREERKKRGTKHCCFSKTYKSVNFKSPEYQIVYACVLIFLLDVRCINNCFNLLIISTAWDQRNIFVLKKEVLHQYIK